MQEDFYMNIDYEAIGRRIRTRRIQKAMTQEQLAALIEREPAYLSRIEHGNQKPSLDTLLRKYSAAMSDVNMVAVQSMIPSAKKVIDEKKQGGYNTNQQQILWEAAYEH